MPPPRSNARLLGGSAYLPGGNWSNRSSRRRALGGLPSRRRLRRRRGQVRTDTARRLARPESPRPGGRACLGAKRYATRARRPERQRPKRCGETRRAPRQCQCQPRRAAAESRTGQFDPRLRSAPPQRATPRTARTDGQLAEAPPQVTPTSALKMMKSAPAPAAPATYSLAASLALSCRLSPEQEAVLEASFQRAKNVDPVEMELLAAEMGVPEGDVQTWFTARLSQWRKEQGLGANLSGIV